MRGLRTSIDQLRVVNPSLAERIATINRDLEALMTSTSPDPWISSERSRAKGLDGMEPIGRLVVKQRNLVEERNSVILQIQALPGFDFFLKAPSFDTLRSAAVHGSKARMSGTIKHEIVPAHSTGGTFQLPAGR
ncbi:hypothetical protein BC827DRAFT_196122 [Russula dissimulans]|nr:hypothetical protein BC827DRAFT_196122 [Russula dissimulans]